MADSRPTPRSVGEATAFTCLCGGRLLIDAQVWFSACTVSDVAGASSSLDRPRWLYIVKCETCGRTDRPSPFIPGTAGEAPE